MDFNNRFPLIHHLVAPADNYVIDYVEVGADKNDGDYPGIFTSGLPPYENSGWNVFEKLTHGFRTEPHAVSTSSYLGQSRLGHSRSNRWYLVLPTYLRIVLLVLR